MPTIKDAILAAIKTKFPAVNLSKKRLDAIAAKIEAKVIDDETKIDAALTTFDEYNPLAEMAKTDDAIRNYQAKEKDKDKDKKTGDEKTETPSEKATREAAEAKAAADAASADKDTPPYVKQMMEQFASIKGELAAIKGEKTVSTIKGKIAAALKEKDVPEKFYGKWKLPETEEGIDAFVKEVETDYSEFAQAQTDKGFSVMKPPKGGNGQGGGDTKKASKEEVDAVLNNIM